VGLIAAPSIAVSESADGGAALEAEGGGRAEPGRGKAVAYCSVRQVEGWRGGGAGVIAVVEPRLKTAAADLAGVEEAEEEEEAEAAALIAEAGEGEAEEEAEAAENAVA
jgi:hypothetical protein